MLYPRILLTAMLVTVPVSHAVAQGYISGTIRDSKEEFVLPAANVRVFNALNAEIVCQTQTDSAGVFTAPVPSGTYKIRVDLHREDKSGHTCYEEFLGVPDSGGKTLHADVFETAKEFVVGGGTTLADGSVAPFECRYAVCLEVDSVLEGVVIDSGTGLSINGIVVTAKSVDNAMPKVPDVPDVLETAADGAFLWTRYHSCGVGDVKVRFHDPQGRYAPEYYQDRGDSFSLGDVVKPSEGEGAHLGTVQLSRVSVPDRLQNLADQVSALPIADEAKQSLTPPVGQAQTLLGDANPNNDKAACGLLKAFVNGLDGAVASGKITAAQRDSLAAAAEAIRQQLSCKS